MFSFFRKKKKKTVRILMGCNPREHCRPLFQELGILTVASLYIMMSETRFLDYTPTTHVTTET
ncbi:hypothetical protein C0J52_01422 [Blattella germanica]|nr:hypothetical protein C0J52_01422 [Blattella germanica]